jgi:hypothetical protein
MSAHDRKPGTLMQSDEWTATARVRRELVERLGHETWSKMTVLECDDAVRAEAAKCVGAES